ncbi:MULTISPECIES: hypothetical protein [Micromonospora]|uniref:Uncharacterized protein n=1 Tax=Micromonospora maris TaxID=1003110 RepID=A0A9X0LD12_9ACTN|nr:MULTISPECIES: hypothetical protein [Micromonospora]AEB46425.1 hypothetical protein VAB18032_26761 [Micromonospora maris AB-18-032]KUJ45654.1 hypothetical protein ADL17_21705 [Micromonospora maris]RUL94286.1 hypothetical protein EG812_00820 [Verrucosispora sp. FIM060022]
MIVISLALILVAVALLVLGLASGSSLLLVVSIGASLLAAVALVAGARQAAAARSTTQRDTAGGRSVTIPAQHVPPTTNDGASGWRQPPGPPAGAAPGTNAGTAEAYDDEPPAQEVTPEQAVLVSRLSDEVRVVDGRPRYHLDECAHLVGRDHEPLPVAEAVELGFTPCATCAPDTTLLSQSGRR